MNLNQMTKNKDQICNFARLIKSLKAEYYNDKLQGLLSQNGCQVLFFGTSLPNDYKKLAKNFENVPFNFCMPDEIIEDSKTLYDIPVIKLSALKNFASKDKVLVLIRHEALSLKFWDYFNKLGIKNILIYERAKNYARVARSLLMHIREIYDVYDSLDTLSKEYYTAVLCGKISGDIRKIRFSDEKQYFIEGYNPIKGDIVIDGGAYDGMTAKAFSNIGCQVYSFEMDRLNYQKGLQLAQNEKFVLENMGLGKRKAELQYRANGVGSAISKDGDERARVIDIDTYVNEKGLPQIDFIKMDIEGSEMSALQGAAKSIVEYKPKMAICTYHKLQDIWEIPLYIKKLRPDYEFAFRHHIIDGGKEYLWNKDELHLLDEYAMDYKCKSMWESVLYCR